MAHKLEPSEILKVTVGIEGVVGITESFLAKLQKSGRVVIPELAIASLKRKEPISKAALWK